MELLRIADRIPLDATVREATKGEHSWLHIQTNTHTHTHDFS